ncbi:hypothetical protein P4O66_013612 [Electrophorus voltai]|uniref:Exocyst complex component Sec6 n=1 Tax=Electrophorus voltai TaxID=2609070 RepID=A0AAD8Z346_9TELE|nr:hypothetical protein P4O66_013612 [Electrophorus voltai]
MAGNGKAESDWASEVSDILMWDNGSQQTEITGNSKAQSNGKGKKLGVMKSLRESIKRAGEKSPLPMNKKGIKCKTEMADIGNEPGNMSDPQIQPPSSPSLSIGSLPSPQQKLGDLCPHSIQNQTFQPSHSRIQSDSVVVLGDEPPKKRQTSRWSFRLGNRKEKTCQPEQLEVVTEVTRGAEEVGMSYTLPEIPLSPLSVMQIKKLIDMEVLEEAYLNLLSLRLEFQREKEALGEEALPLELAHKDKDLSLLYSSLRTKLTDIVQKSCALPSRNKELLVHVACIVQEEEKRERDVGGMLGWRDVWRAAVQEGVRDTIRQVHLDSYEQNPSWLAVHLGLLGKAIVADLEKCHSLHSENVMGRISLQPELTDEQRALKLDGVFLEQIKTGYYNCLQVEIRLSLDKVTELEYEEMWKDKKTPEIEEGIYSSHIDMDIWMNVKGKIQASKDVNLEQKAVYCCLEELKQFPRRLFEADFVKYSDTVQDPSLWAAYHITYINSFSALKNHMENYKESCPYQVEQLGKEVDGLVQRLWQALLEYFKTDIKPFLRMMMTKTWLTSDEDFQQLVKRIRTLSQQCRHCSPERVQAFVSDMHYSVVRGYVSQLMKNNYTCKNRKNERAATKIREQWGELKEVFQEMNSVHHWLYPVGDHLSKIIGYRNKSEIKNILQPLIDDYPDISKRHLSAILYFRGMIRGRERQIILQQFSNQKQQSRNAESTQHALFADIPAAVNTDCLANMPFSCLYGLLPDS